MREYDGWMRVTFPSFLKCYNCMKNHENPKSLGKIVMGKGIINLTRHGKKKKKKVSNDSEILSGTM